AFFPYFFRPFLATDLLVCVILLPIIYSGAVFYHTNLAGYFNEYPWWVAHYYQRRPDNDGMAWRFWQHSDRGQVDGINGPVDFNVFHGTVEESGGSISLLLI
ncbi:GH25 family lysozyme, partial [Escherichia coli]